MYEIDPELYETLQSIVEHTNNDAIYFGIVILIGLILVLIPMYILMIKNKKETKAAEMNEKKLLLDVVANNTSAITNLTATMDLNNTTVTELLQSIRNITSDNSLRIVKLAANQDSTNEKLDMIIDSNAGMADFIKDGRSELIKLDLIKEQGIGAAYKLESIEKAISDLHQLAQLIQNGQNRYIGSNECEYISVNHESDIPNHSQ